MPLSGNGLLKVSLKILGLQASSLSLCLKPASWCLLFFKDEFEAGKSLKAFSYSQNYN